MTEPTNTPDDTETMTLDELGEAMLEASDRWDGDEAMQHHVTAFLRFYADLDRRITDARMASADGDVILFRWDDEQGTLVQVENYGGGILLMPGAVTVNADDDTDEAFTERLLAAIHAGEMPADEVRESAGYTAKAASAHHGLADASTIADRIAAEQARDAEAE